MTDTPDYEHDNGKGTGTLEAVEVEYFNWGPPSASVSVHMHLGAIEGMARDIMERLSRQPRPNVEVGGLLLGRLKTADRPEVWIERYQRIPCAHSFGPKFVLDRDDMEGLEKAATTVLASGDIAVVGFYRSHARPGFQLEESDFELIRRYFSDPSDLILLVKAETPANLTGQFFTWDAVAGARPAGGEFPFSGRVVSSDTLPDTPGTADDAEVTSLSRPRPGAAPPANGIRGELPRRLVPDFNPSPVEPAPSLYGLADHAGHDTDIQPDDDEPRGGGLRKWLPLLAALLLVGGIAWLMLRPPGHTILNPAPAQVAETGLPLGLYVDSSGPTWRVLWNPNATALQHAHTVQLYVREGDEQTRIELMPRDLTSGSYPYKPAGNDVTFRLEVADQTGQVSAESFRLQREPAAAAAPATPAAPAPPAAKPSSAPPAEPSRFVPPKATYRAPPVVAAGIRPRIKGTVAVDVRVHIDARGRVTAAAPITKQHSGLEEYLASRAVQAARLWKFEPARENGAAVAGTQTLHFVFEK